MRRVDLADAGFLLLEKKQTPMHVGGVNLFTLPQDVDEQKFLAGLRQVLTNAEEYRKPFGEYVRTGRAGPLGPLYWERDDSLDLDYHVRHSALPNPGRYRELFALVSRLHGTLLDRNRPLWEVHLIEGLQDRQFALYTKVHHAAVDGIGAMHMTQAMCSTNKNARTRVSPFSLAAYEKYKSEKYGSRPQRVVPRERELRAVAEAFKQQFDTTANLSKAFSKWGSVLLGRGGNLSMPWHQIPKTSFNTEVTAARRFVAQSWDFERVKRVCKALDGTLNDIVLAMCAGALRRYLLAQNELPKHSLKAMTPVSLREEGDLDSGNAISFITADLATSIADPARRLHAIQDSMRAGKDMLRGMTAREAMIFSQITQAPILLSSILGLSSQFPAFSTVISNVPGPRQELYWNGARLDGIYPASIVFDGFAMNITLVSYGKSLDFGIIACRRSVPQVQRLIDYLEDALVELEEVAGLTARPAKRAPRAKTAAGTKARATAKAKTKPKAKAKPKIKTKAKSKAKSKAKPRPKPKTQSKAQAKTQAKAKAPAKVKAKTKTPPRLKARTSASAKPKPKARPKS